MRVKIITDSGSDLLQEILEGYGIDVVPLLVLLDGREYVDGRDIDAKDVYNALREGKMPKTNQATAEAFQQILEPYAKSEQPCLYIGFSSAMSGTFQAGKLVAAQLTEAYPSWECQMIDSLSGSLGQGLLVLRAARMAEQGASLADIAQVVSAKAGHMEHIFTVDDLNHLHRGGRLSKAGAVVGSMLRIKPVLHIRDGIIEPIEKKRGKNKAIKRLVEIMEQRCSGEDQVVAISHADDPEAAETLRQLVEQQLGFKEFVINIVGSVLGCHIGLGGVAVFFESNTPQGQA